MSRMQEEINQPEVRVYAGIDVGKSALDICIHPSTDKRQFKNDAAGIRSLVRQYQRHGVQLIALEAMGRIGKVPEAFDAGTSTCSPNIM